jgi:ubiquinone biosynthesis protein
MPPFPMAEARASIEARARPAVRPVRRAREPVAAASIAQVHKPPSRTATDGPRTVAVKVLRPGRARPLPRDLDAMRFAARNLIERSPGDPAAAAGRGGGDAGALGRDRDGSAAGGRRAVRDGENTKDDPGFRVPARLGAHRAATC